MLYESWTVSKNELFTYVEIISKIHEMPITVNNFKFIINLWEMQLKIEKKKEKEREGPNIKNAI